jgi:hypothetical protein
MSCWSSAYRLAGEACLPSDVGCRVWLEKASGSKCYTLSMNSAKGRRRTLPPGSRPCTWDHSSGSLVSIMRSSLIFIDWYA